MFLVPINYLAVLTSAVLAMVVGFLWYRPLFGKEWMKLIGMTKEKMEAAKKEMTKTYTVSFLLSFLSMTTSPRLNSEIFCISKGVLHPSGPPAGGYGFTPFDISYKTLLVL